MTKYKVTRTEEMPIHLDADGFFIENGCLVFWVYGENKQIVNIRAYESGVWEEVSLFND